MDPLRYLGMGIPHAAGRWRWFRWRSVLLLGAVTLGLFGLLSGVGVSERLDVVHAGLLTKLYYTLGLFIFGGMDLGTPVGGPWWGRAALWTAYFIAPLITASAVIEAIWRLVGVDSFLLRRLEGHVIVAGCSRLTVLYLRRLRELHPRMSVVVVADPSEHATAEFLRDEFNVPLVEGDITSEAVLGRLRLSKAARVLLLTDDDFTNLDAATLVLERIPDDGEHVIAHVGDLGFMRSMAATRLAKRCQVFNGHQIAATHLVEEHLLGHFQQTEHIDQVVLAGFGRFGQTVLEELQQGASGDFDRVIIVDLEATRRTAVFGEQVGFRDDYERIVLDGDIRDPRVWEDVVGNLDADRADPVFVVGSGQDRANLRLAMTLRSRFPQSQVIGRSERPWAFAEALSDEAGVQTLSVAQLVAESMPVSWFGPRTDRGESLAAPSTAGESRMMKMLQPDPEPPRPPA
ncbi:MAG: NAD-binding protein [Nannocystaceae bacterium]|nr:NAD-binding protein [bacterium]